MYYLFKNIETRWAEFFKRVRSDLNPKLTNAKYILPIITAKIYLKKKQKNEAAKIRMYD